MSIKDEIDALLTEIEGWLADAWGDLCYNDAYGADGARQFYDGMHHAYTRVYNKLSTLAEGLGADEPAWGPPDPEDRQDDSYIFYKTGLRMDPTSKKWR